MKSVLIPVSLLILQSISSPIAAQDLPLSARQGDFKTFVQDFENSYAYLDRADKPWLTWESRYSPAVDRANSKEAFAAVLASALGELHDFHAEVRSKVIDGWLPAPTFEDCWAEFTPAGATVMAVRQGGDAQRAGIQAGDVITRIGDQALQAAIAERLSPEADIGNPQARQWALLSILTGRSDEARTFTLEKKGGAVYTVTLPVERRFDRQPSEVSSDVLHGNVGLIRFNNSLGDQKTVAAFDKALLALRGTAGLVLDLRDVPSGGDSSVALGIMGRFVTTLLAYQRHRVPNYGQSDVERNWVEFVAPRGPFTYTAPVVLLVNHWTGSMGEGLAIGFDAMHRAIVVGTPMAHLAGAVSNDKLPRTGVDVAYATEQIYHVDGTPRQNWLPPVLVGEPLIQGSGDVILNRGLKELQNHRQPLTPNDLSLHPRK